jgi:hypothetical protein
MKNRRYHSGIKRSPYEAMFGKKMELGYENQVIPSTNEEQLTDEDNFKTIDGSSWLDLSRKTELKVEVNEEEAITELIKEEGDLLAELDKQDELNVRFFNQRQERQGARESQQIQAQKMLETSNKR